MRRRTRPDPFAPLAEPTWIVRRDRYNNALESARLEPHADLRSALIAALARLIGQGWESEDSEVTETIVFLHRGSERISVSISRSDPHGPGPTQTSEPAWGAKVVPIRLKQRD